MNVTRFFFWFQNNSGETGFKFVLIDNDGFFTLADAYVVNEENLSRAGAYPVEISDFSYLAGVLVDFVLPRGDTLFADRLDDHLLPDRVLGIHNPTLPRLFAHDNV